MIGFEIVGNIGYASMRADDAAAIRLCEELGMRGERSTVVRIRAPLRALAPAGDVCETTPEHDDDIERAFGLPAGRVALARRRGRMLVHVRDRSLAVVGFAALDPVTRVVSPFRVAASRAAALLAALGDCDIVVDDDPALVDVLVAAGGVIVQQLVHYSGEITKAAFRSA